MIDLDELEPCIVCRDRCPTQLQGIDVNGDIPWLTCEACYQRTRKAQEPGQSTPSSDL